MGTNNLKLHKELTGDDLHIPGYVQDNDPGAQGAGKLWIDTNLGTLSYIIKVRNATNTGWSPVAQLWGQIQGTVTNQTDLINYISTQLANYSAISHTHNDLYYTKPEAHSLIAQKADIVHSHNLDDLYDVVVNSGLDDRQVLTWSAAAGVWHNANIGAILVVDHAALIHLDYASSGHTGFAQSVHYHDDRYSLLAHLHDDRYFTKTELSILLNAKADVIHQHNLDDLTNVVVNSGLSDRQVLMWNAAAGVWHNAPITGYALVNHSHTSGQLTLAFINLSDTPNSYISNAGKGVRVNAGENALEFYTVTDVGGVWGQITGTLANQTDLINYLTNTYALSGHLHNDIYFTKPQISSLLSDKANAVHSHSLDSLSDVVVNSGLSGYDVLMYNSVAGVWHNSAITGFALTNHTHTAAQVAMSFLNLSDVPNSYGSNAGKGVRVNAGANGLEFYTVVDVGGVWGSITGTLSSQTDLQNVLDAKYNASNPNGYQTLAQVNALLTGKSNIDHTHSLDELNNVGVTSGLANGQVLRYSSAMGWWINDTIVHNDLTGMQGGAGNEYYHLTSAEYTNVQNLAVTYAPLIHTHDDRYYTKTQTMDYLNAKADIAHAHSLDSLTDVVVNSGLGTGQVLMWNAAAGVWHNSALSFAAVNHSHGAAQINLAFLNLSDAPNSYASNGGKGVRVNAGATGLEFYTIVDQAAVWGGITGNIFAQTDLTAYVMANYAGISHTHDDRYFTKTQTSSFLDAKANVEHTHTLDELSNVVVNSGLAANQTLVWNAAAGVWHNKALNLQDLGNVSIDGAPTNNYVLTYESATQKWKAKAGGGGGGTWGTITGTVTDKADLVAYLSGTYSVLSHLHDDRYFTKTVTSTLLNGKADSVHAHSLDSLTDVVVNSGLASGHVLTWNAGASVWYNRALNLKHLADVLVDNPLNNQILSYNSSSQKWTATTPKLNSKSFVLNNPTTACDFPVWRVPYAITITGIHVLCFDGTNIVGNLWEYDSNGANGATVDSDITALAGHNCNDDGTLSNPSIAAGNYLGWKTTSVSGSVTKVMVTFEYTID